MTDATGIGGTITTQDRGAPELAEPWPPIETAQSALIGFTVAMLGIAPRLAPVLVELIAVACLAHELSAGRSPMHALRRALSMPLGWCGAGFLGFAALSSLWSLDLRLAISTVAAIGILMLATGYAWAALDHQLAGLSAQRQRRFVRAIPIGAAAAILFMLLEEAMGHAILLSTWRAFPGLFGGDDKIILSLPGEPLRLNPFVLNRNAAALTVLAPVVLLAMALWLPDARRRLLDHGRGHRAGTRHSVVRERVGQARRAAGCCSLCAGHALAACLPAMACRGLYRRRPGSPAARAPWRMTPACTRARSYRSVHASACRSGTTPRSPQRSRR